MTTHAVLVEKIEARLARAGLPSLIWYDALWALERALQQRVRLHELAEKMVLSRSNLTRLIDRLVAAGLVRREKSTVDGRGAYGVLTEAGAHMRAQMWTVYKLAIAELFARPLLPQDIECLESALSQLLKHARSGPIGKP